MLSETTFGQGVKVPALDVEAPNGKHNTLIASMHMGYDGLHQPTSAVLEGAKVFVVEHIDLFGMSGSDLDIGSPSGIEMKAWTEGKALRAAWSRHLSEAEVAILRERIACITGFPETSTFGQTELYLSVTRAFPAMIRAYRLCVLRRAEI